MPENDVEDWRRYLNVPEPYGQVPPLSEWLNEWLEIDLAGFVLGVTLGLFEKGTPYPKVRFLFWKAGLVGETLIKMIQNMVEAGILESRDDGNEVRWSPDWTDVLKPVLQQR